MTIRKKYPKEFKLDAISLVLEQGYGVTEAANNLGIAQALLSRWIKEHKPRQSSRYETYAESLYQRFARIRLHGHTH